MSYTEKQKSEYVKELQKSLFLISQWDKRIPVITPDGIFGPDTQSAVSAFQQYYGLLVTGEVDKATWDEIAAKYKMIYEATPDVIDIFPSQRYMIRPGDSGNLVLQLQLMLFALAGAYSNMVEPEQNGIYGEKTESSVRELQRISMLPQTGETDVHTWNRLAKWFSSQLKR